MPSFFAKHFLYEIFAQLRMGKGVIETFLFLYGEGNYSIFELYTLKNNGSLDIDIQDIFEDVRNVQSYWVICNLFGYNQHAKGTSLTPFNYEESVSEYLNAIHIRDKNDKKDRLIWNLLCNGTSEYTDYEARRNLMLNEVLSKPGAEQASAYELLRNDIYYGKAGKSGNSVAEKMGGASFFVELFRSFSLTPNSSDSWHKLISFYFHYENVVNIDQRLIEVLNYGGIDKKDVYIDILNRFNSLNVIGGLRHQKTYIAFLYNYINALNRLRFVYTHSAELLHNIDGAIHSKELVEILESVSCDVEKLADTGIEAIIKDAETIKNFLVKNIEIVNNNNLMKYLQPGIKVDVHSHQTDEFKRLMNYSRSDIKTFVQELEKSYKENKITAQEIIQIQSNPPKSDVPETD